MVTTQHTTLNSALCTTQYNYKHSTSSPSTPLHTILNTGPVGNVREFSVTAEHCQGGGVIPEGLEILLDEVSYEVTVTV